MNPVNREVYVGTFDLRAPVTPVPPSRHVDSPDGSQDVISFGSIGAPGPRGIFFDRHGSALQSIRPYRACGVTV